MIEMGDRDTLAADYAEAGSGWREQQCDKSWAELALFEKLDHLRGRIVALEAHRIAQEAEKRAEPTWTAAYKSGALRVILERLERIEQAQVDELTREPGWSVSVAELARLRRVEEAARAVDAHFGAAREMQVTLDRDWRQVAADRSNLRAALDSEPKR